MVRREHGHERLIACLLLTAIAVAARAQTFWNPVIGFDEQFYLLVGDEMWHHVLPYVDIFDRKPIGLFLIYALARAPGGDGFLAYKLLALVSVVITALLVYRVARWRAGPVGALAAATCYILWLDFLEGEGGQAPIFYCLPMIAAVAVIGRAIRRRAALRWPGAVAMLLIGVALQIKYSVVAEGVYVGCFLIAAAWRAGDRGGELAGSIALWIGCAMLPTAAAFGFYAAIGHAADFVFANFLSVLGQGRAAGAVQAEGAAVIAGILAPLAIFLLAGWRGRARPAGGVDLTGFLLGWLAAAVIGVVTYWRFASPHYAIPILLPLVILLGAVIDGGRMRRRAALALVTAAFVGGQAVLAISADRKGGAAAAAAVARAAHTTGGCIYVYDGYPALYMLTGSCLPTRWAFPGHLNTREEAHRAALGIDPAVEVQRILATRPTAIVDDFPRFTGGNPVTHRILQATLDSDYSLIACVPTGPARVRLVYRRQLERGARAGNCPSDAALRRGR